jgi:uncharacterized protein (DUF849 family)
MTTIISAALTGAVTPKSKNPALPITPKEIACDAIRVWKAGAAIVHLHMRDENAKGTMDKELFREAVERIRGETDLIINLTSSGETGASDERRIEHIVELRPEMASFDAGTFNWMPAGVFSNTPDFLRKLGRAMTTCGVKPEIEIFDSGMIHSAVYFMEKEQIIQGPLHFQFVLGVLGAAQATVDNLVYLRNQLPAGCTWAGMGVGTGHLPILLATLAMGGHVRVGLEDNLYYAKGRLATNEELVARAARLIVESNNEIASPSDARKILGLKN